MNSGTDWITRPETASDIASIRHVNLAAFDTSDEADLVDALRKDEAWIGDLSFVAVDPNNGMVVGHALLTRNHIGDAPAVCLAPCAVLPEYQRSGVGYAVIRSALDAASAMGEKYVTVLGHPEYYPRFGFERASTFGVRMKVAVPDAALMVLKLGSTAIPAGVIRYPLPFGDI